MTSSKSAAEKASTGYRQSPILEFFLQEDTSKHDDPRGRKRTTPMKVLCLGLPRSGKLLNHAALPQVPPAREDTDWRFLDAGTESLAKALEILDMKAYHDKSSLAPPLR